MLCVIQRVSRASVAVDGTPIAEIGTGLLVLAAVATADTDADLAWTARKLLELRLFPSDDGTRGFDRDVAAVGGSILAVSNFTLTADASRGRRPSLSAAAPPSVAEPMFARFLDLLRAGPVPIAAGRFGADMVVSCDNVGPATFLLNSADRASPG